MRKKVPMMTMSKKWVAFLTVFLIVASLAPVALADDWYSTPGGYYTVNQENGQKLFEYAGVISIDDEYISSDNKRYRVVSVDDASHTATARYVEDVVLWAGYSPTMAASVMAQQGQKKVGLYCSHTDESYIPGDGSEAKPNHGGIVDVANTLCDQLKSRGIDATADDTPHDPHDAGAYRRSRSSAMNLMESKQPDLLLDIHRDGVPNPEEYDFSINGKQCSKFRFVVGRSNQNKAANEDTAKKMKQIADTTYPGLVKDIFIGHGSYNQDLTPNSLLMEIGTHTVEKDRVINTTSFIADVVAKFLGVTGTQASSQPQAQAQGQTQGQAQASPNVQQESQKNPTANRTSAKSIAWIVGVVGAACLIFLLVATVKGQRKERVGNFFKEVTGLGKHRDKDDK